MITFLLVTFIYSPDAHSQGASGVLLNEGYSEYLLFEQELSRPFLFTGLSIIQQTPSYSENKIFLFGGAPFDSLNSLKVGTSLYSGPIEKQEFLLLLGRNLYNFGTFLGIEGIIQEGDTLTKNSLSGLHFKTGLQGLSSFVGKSKFSISIGGIGIVSSVPYFHSGINLSPDTSISFFEPTLGLNFTVNSLKFWHLGTGAEVWLFKNYGLGLGAYFEEKFSTPFISLGLGYHTRNIEKTDFSIDISLTSNGNYSLFTFSFKILPGDALAKEKLRKKKQEEKMQLAEIAKKLKDKEQELLSLKKELEKREEEILMEKGKIVEERERLKQEKEKIEALRKEALEAIQKIEGLKIEEKKEYIKITAEEKAVHFELGGTGLQIQGIKALKAISNFLKTYPDYKVRIEGHTDNLPIGPLLKHKYKDNTELSKARAKTVLDYFVEIEGLKEKNFTYEGFGESRPVAKNDNEENRAKNRRVEIYIEKGE